MQTTHDPDAENEVVEVVFTVTDDATNATALTAPTTATTVTINDDETQTYVLMLNSGETPTEGKTFKMTLKAEPAHVQGMKTLRLHLSDSMYKLDSTPADGSVMLGDDDATDNTGATTAVDGAAEAGRAFTASITIKAPSQRQEPGRGHTYAQGAGRGEF